MNDMLKQRFIAGMGLTARRLGASERHGHSFALAATSDAPLSELEQALASVCAVWHA